MRYFVIAIVILILNIAAIAALYFIVDHQINKKGLQILQVEQQINQFGDLGKEVDGLSSEKKAVQSKLAAISKLEKAQDSTSRVLVGVADVIPREVWLTELIKKDLTLTLSGYAMTDDNVASFVSALKKTSLFLQVSINSAQPKNIDGASVRRFQLTCVLRGEA